MRADQVRRLIINADDFGFTAGVNEGIIQAHAHGVVTSSTLMANGPAFANAVELAKTVPRLGVGCHVVLVDGVPLLPPQRKDGTLESLIVVSGHPMLAEAAVSSAQQSGFECQGCEQEVTSYALIYSFQFVASDGWPCPERPGPHVTQSGNRISVTTEPKLVHPYFSGTKERSAKCLYLWACGRHWGGEDYYYSRVRSAKCLDLWSCGHRLREPFATCEKLHRKLSY